MKGSDDLRSKWNCKDEMSRVGQVAMVNYCSCTSCCPRVSEQQKTTGACGDGRLSKCGARSGEPVTCDY